MRRENDRGENTYVSHLTWFLFLSTCKSLNCNIMKTWHVHHFTHILTIDFVDFVFIQDESCRSLYINYYSLNRTCEPFWCIVRSYLQSRISYRWILESINLIYFVSSLFRLLSSFTSATSFSSPYPHFHLSAFSFIHCSNFFLSTRSIAKISATFISSQILALCCAVYRLESSHWAPWKRSRC